MAPEGAAPAFDQSNNQGQTTVFLVLGRQRAVLKRYSKYIGNSWGAEMKFIITILLCAFVTAAFAQQVYKWVDKDGHVHYSQTPPKDKSDHAKSIDVTPQASDPTGVQDAQNLEQQMQARDKQATTTQQKADAAARKKALMQQRCNALRSELQMLKQVGPVATVDASGKRTYMTDAQHTQKEQQLQSEINQDCGS
ncbi:MAG: DUF4124 domain-containing protein [Candidatus Saccharimonadales bacterium]